MGESVGSFHTSIKSGDPIELPDLGNMMLFLEKLTALNPEMEVRDRRPSP